MADKNMGRRQFVSSVHEDASLCPGKHTMLYAERVDKVKENERRRRVFRGYCRRRLDLRTQRGSTQASQEVREGTTYQSVCSSVNDKDLDMAEIPPALSQPPRQQLPSLSVENVVVFDIETTGLGNDCEVTQLTACLLSDPAKSFAQYVLPSGQISKEASAITKLTTRRESGRTILS